MTKIKSIVKKFTDEYNINLSKDFKSILTIKTNSLTTKLSSGRVLHILLKLKKKSKSKVKRHLFLLEKLNQKME